MSTKVRPELTKGGNYWIDKHRFYELKHFCMQYHKWIKDKALYKDKIKMIEDAAHETDEVVGLYILEGIVDELSYDKMNARVRIPCCRETYYDLYRRFFWILDKKRD